MMGVLAFLDPTHLFALSSHYAARTLPYAQANVMLTGSADDLLCVCACYST